MKKMNFLKVLMTLVLAFVVTGAFAQVAGGDYSEYDADTQAPTTTEYVTLHGAGTTLGYYALPDPTYHPNYNAGGGWALTADFTWSWTAPIDPGTVPTFAQPGDANYVEITYAATGVYEINVAETAPAAFGGCTDATPTVMDVTVIDPPTGDISIAPVGWQEITANQEYQICGDQAAETVTIDFVENVPDALASYSFQITETIELLDGAGTVLSTSQAETVIEEWALGSKLKATNLNGNGDATTLTNATFTTATPNFSFEFDSDALDVLQNAGIDARTRYTYKITRAGSTADPDFISAISHKSGYIDGLTYTAFTNDAVSFIVNPSPSTGPIYHIANDFNY